MSKEIEKLEEKRILKKEKVITPSWETMHPIKLRFS